MRKVKCLIIGAGAAGMACALGAYKNGINDILIVERDKEIGGILNQCIHNGFGLHTFHEELSGPSYAQIYYEKLANICEITVMLETTVVQISEDKKVYVLSKNGYEMIEAETIILSSGSLERSAGAIGLKGDRSQGIYTAGSAQQYLNKEGFLVGKKVFILGSGDIGLIMARRMMLEGAKVIGVAEIMPYSNGLARNIKQCLDDFDIPLYLSSTVTRTIGKPRLKAIELSKVDENRNAIKGSEKIIEVDCLLLSVGLLPEDTLLEELDVDFDSRTKAVIVNEQYMTSIPGIFACGNALHIHDLVDFVSKEAYVCGSYCAKYIKDQKINKSVFHHELSKDIGYVLPQRFSSETDVEFSLRVTNVFRQCKLHVYGKGLDKCINMMAMVPSEMIKVKITKEELQTLEDLLYWEVLS